MIRVSRGERRREARSRKGAKRKRQDKEGGRDRKGKWQEWEEEWREGRRKGKGWRERDLKELREGGTERKTED